MLKLLLSPEGRINRKQYWLASLGLFVAMMGAMVMIAGLAAATSDLVALILLPAYLLTYWASFVLSIKRLHDVGMSGYWSLLGFVMLGVAFTPGQPGENKYGPEPSDELMDREPLNTVFA